MKRSCFSDDCGIHGSNTVVLAWTRPRKSRHSLEKVGRIIPEEDMGEQIGPTKKVVQFEAERWTMQKHVKMLTEIFDELSIIGDPLDEKNQVVHLLASLLESYDLLVTALEASPEVLKLEIVTEGLLHEETKQRDKESSTIEKKATTSKHQTSRKGPKCCHCGRFGHIKRECRMLLEGPGKNQDNRMSYSNKMLLKVVSATFFLVHFLCLKDSNCETRKNDFYFTSKALFVLEIIRF